MKTSVGVDGASLRRTMAALPAVVDAIAAAVVADSGEAVAAGTRDRVARDTGNLSSDVEVRFSDGGLTVEVGWFIGGDDTYAPWVEQGTSSQPAQPALRPAAEEESTRFAERLTEAIMRELS